MSELNPNPHHLREALLFYFNMKKSADWLRLTGLPQQILMVKRLAISDRTCRREWFQRLKWCWKGKGERQTRKGFHHRIVTGDNNPNPNPSAENHVDCPVVILQLQSTPRPNIHGSKVMLCVWWGPAWCERYGTKLMRRLSRAQERRKAATVQRETR
nr:Mariner Mos1 transposase [Hymenolepis microstoma]